MRFSGVALCRAFGKSCTPRLFHGACVAQGSRSKMTIEKIQPDTLFKRAVGGHVLYSHVVVASGEKLVFVSGQLARDKDGQIVGPKDKRAQSRQVGENLKNAREAAGATLNDLVKTTTFVTDIGEFFKHVDVRHNYP